MLDFRKRKKKYFDVILHDGTKLQLPMPTMAVYRELVDVSKLTGNDNMDSLTNLLNVILKSNKNQVPITDEHLTSFDVEDIIELFVGYAEMVQKELNNPNLSSPIIPWNTEIVGGSSTVM